MRLNCAAPAKINLALHVTGRRADGYHLLHSLVVFTTLGDRVTGALAERDGLEIDGPFAAHVPNGPDNLVLAAREAMRRRFGASCRRPAVLRLEKNLPAAAGIGGGSSDAAATLRLLQRLWSSGTDATLHDLALELGADVPMCLNPGPHLASGIGEELEPVADLPSLALVLANPGRPLATPAVFARLERRDNPPLPALSPFADAAALAAWLAATRNDLEAPAKTLVPEIAAVLDALSSTDALLARMSGSGASCFGLYEDAARARAAAASIAERNPAWFVRATTTLPRGTIGKAENDD